MKNKALLIIIMSITTFLKAQNYYILELNVCDEKRHPKQFELVYVYSEQKELSWSISDEYGNIEFILSPADQNNDSIYFIFGKRDSIKQDTIYLKDIRLMEENAITHHVIILQKFETYSKQEFDEYKRKHQLLPDRVIDGAMDKERTK